MTDVKIPQMVSKDANQFCPHMVSMDANQFCPPQHFAWQIWPRTKMTLTMLMMMMTTTK